MSQSGLFQDFAQEWGQMPSAKIQGGEQNLIQVQGGNPILKIRKANCYRGYESTARPDNEIKKPL